MADDRRQAVIGPTEFAVLVKFYNSILAEPWFTTDREQRDRFRRYIIKAFRAGVTETDQLAAHCHEIARHHFSSDPASSVPG
jgi:hypothetical protein